MTDLSLPRSTAFDRAALDAHPDICVVIDPAGRIVRLNRAGERALGLDEPAVFGRTFTELAAEIREIFVWDDIMAEMAAQLANPDPLKVYRGPVAQRFPVKREYYATSVAVMERDRYAGRLWTLHDITRERQAERERIEFMNLASHELRTPLTARRTFVDLMLEDDDAIPPARRHDLLLRMQSSVGRWMALMDNIRTVDRVESVLFELDYQPLDLGNVIAAAVEGQQAAATERRITILLHGPPEPVTVRADEHWLPPILENLLSNAIKYGRDGGQVDIGWSPGPRDMATVTVRDDGTGMTPDEQARIFTKFFRAGNRAAGGTGLGLAIARQLTELHGGELDVSSIPGAGSTFTITLRRLPDPA